MAAESVGLAASIGGIVSLGLTITGGIIKYVDAFENRQKELDFVSRQNEVLKSVLLELDGYLSSHGQSGAVPDAAAQSMQLFERELNHVKALHSELADSPTQCWTSRLRNRKKRVTYAFDRSKIQELGQQLQKAGDVLQLTLNVLGLQVLRQNADTLAAVGSSSQGMFSELSMVRSELAAIETPIVNVNDQLCLLRGGMNSNTQILVSEIEALSIQVQGSRNDLRNVQETNNAVHRLTQLQSRRDQQYEEMTKNIGQILEHLQQGDIQVPAREAVVRGLVGKPALLKKLSDEVQSSEQTHVQLARPQQCPRRLQIPGSLTRHSPSKPIMGRFCTCPRLQSAMNSKWLQMGHASFSGQWETIAHWAGCPMARMASKERIAIGIRYNGLIRMLKAAVNVSFSMTSGAGGFSISPNFTCSPTVDTNLDPAFRIVTLMGESLMGDALWRVKDTTPRSFVVACMRRLIRLFNDRKVFATAVDSQNMNLMHYAIMTLNEIHLRFGEDRREIIDSLFVEPVQMLISYGVSAFSFDLEGMSPLVKMAWLSFAHNASQAIMNILIQANSEDHPLILDTSYTELDKLAEEFFIPTIAAKALYNVSSGFARVSACGPLSMAVVQDDIDEVERILTRSPGSIAETDVYGQTPFHLAAAKPWILEVLLEYGDCNILDRRDSSGFTALETAMVHTSDYCDNGQDTNECDSNECGCCLCVDLFFGVECNVRMEGLAVFDHTPELLQLLSNASELARQKYVHYMERRRITVRSLSSGQSASTKSSDCESDTESEIAEIEWRTTSSSEQSELSSLPDVADDMSWVFLEIQDPHHGELFYRHGFHPHPSCLDHMRSMNYAYLHWLVSHAVDPFFRSSKGPAPTKDCPNNGLFGAHFAFYLLPLCFQNYRREYHSSRYIGSFLAFATTVLNRDLTDACQCHCTINGCTPFTWMMKASHFFYNSPGDPEKIRDENVGRFVSHYSRCGLELTSLTYKAAIRYATFEALGLVHTCCYPRRLIYYGNEWVERDDVGMVNEEQAFLLGVLEALVKEFEEKALEFMKLDSTGNSPFPQFWVLCWKTRMEEELEKLEGKDLTDAERRGAEEIGVRWQASQQESEKGNLFSIQDPEYWFYELDRICPEYVEPWPEELRQVSE